MTDQSTETTPLGKHKLFDSSFLITLTVCIAAAIGVTLQEGPMRVLEIAINYLGFLAILTPKILCGFFIAAALPVLIPREVITKWVGSESGWRGVAVASIAGGLVPGGPSMIFALCVSFRAAGASVPVLISFITAWSVYGVNRTVIWEMSFLHVDFVLLRVLVCLPLPFLAGLFAQKVLR